VKCSRFFCKNLKKNDSVALRNGFVAATPVKSKLYRELKNPAGAKLFSGLFLILGKQKPKEGQC